MTNRDIRTSAEFTHSAEPTHHRDPILTPSPQSDDDELHKITEAEPSQTESKDDSRRQLDFQPPIEMNNSIESCPRPKTLETNPFKLDDSSLEPPPELKDSSFGGATIISADLDDDPELGTNASGAP